MTGATSRRKGATGEATLARYLQANGWPQARRAIVTGNSTTADPGDIRSTPGIVWSVKNVARDQIDKHIPQWLTELDAMNGLGDQLGGIPLLVVKRAGQANPARWWCYLRLHWLDTLRSTRPQPYGCSSGCGQQPVRLELATIIELLAHAGYTRPAREASA